jgi:glycerol 2-dehydrogenase (NADP+)
LEIHVYNPEHNLVEYSKSKGIVVEAYAPLGSADSPILLDEHVVQIAKKHSINPADVLLGYLSML